MKLITTIFFPFLCEIDNNDFFPFLCEIDNNDFVFTFPFPGSFGPARVLERGKEEGERGNRRIQKEENEDDVKIPIYPQD